MELSEKRLKLLGSQGVAHGDMHGIAHGDAHGETHGTAQENAHEKVHGAAHGATHGATRESTHDVRINAKAVAAAWFYAKSAMEEIIVNRPKKVIS